MPLQLVYLASPYTDPKLSVRRLRFRQVRRIAARLVERGVHLYCPIVHGHSIDEITEIPIPYEYWLDSTADILVRCDKLYVVQLSGWRESRGVSIEIDLAKFADMPTFYVNPIDCSIAPFPEPA